MSVFNLIQNGYTLGTTSPVVSGMEDWLYIFNEGDMVISYDPTNPLIAIGITPVAAAKIWKFTGTNNSFKPSVKSNKTTVGPRYAEEIDFNIAGNSASVKAMVMAAGYGRVRAIVVNNFKATDAAIELYGANNGMLVTEADKNEASEGGWILKLGPPDKLMEPYPPRSVFIPPVSGAATYATTLAAIEALVGVNV